MRKAENHNNDPTISPAIVAAIAANLEAQMNSFSSKNAGETNRQSQIPEHFTKDDLLKIAFRAHLPVDANDSRQALTEQLIELLSPEALKAQVERTQQQKDQQ